jgi:glycosyltransferase involved in cell wall biosynthesis
MDENREILMIHLSIITPTYNEADTILACIDKLRDVMQNSCSGLTYEHLIIDNASSDDTAGIAIKESLADPRIKVIVNSRNIGASRSIYRALARVKGQWTIPMLPADLQDPAEVIPLMISEIKDDVEIVYGVRTNRQENFLLRNLRRFYYRVLSRASTFKLQNDAGEFVLISSRVRDSIIQIKDENPYIRGLIAQTNAKSVSIPYVWKQRIHGKSKSSPLVLADVAISGIVSTTHIPARIALVFGFFTSALGVIAGIVYFFLSFSTNASITSGIPTIIIAIFFLGGVQLFFLGLIGEYVLSIHRQIKPEPAVTSIRESNF